MMTKFKKYLFLSVVLVVIFIGFGEVEASSKVRGFSRMAFLVGGHDRPIYLSLPFCTPSISLINMSRMVKVNLKRADGGERRVKIAGSQSGCVSFNINESGHLTGELATKNLANGLFDFSLDIYDDNIENLWVRGESNVAVESIKKDGTFWLRRFGLSTVNVKNLEVDQLHIGSWGQGAINIENGRANGLSLGVYGGSVFNAPGLVSKEANVWVRDEEDESKWVIRDDESDLKIKKGGSVILGHVEKEVRVVVDENGKEISYQGSVLNGISVGGVSIGKK